MAIPILPLDEDNFMHGGMEQGADGGQIVSKEVLSKKTWFILLSIRSLFTGIYVSP